MWEQNKFLHVSIRNIPSISNIAMTLKAATVFVVRMEIANGGPGSLITTFVWCTTTAQNLDIQILLCATNASVVRESMYHQDDAYVINI